MMLGPHILGSKPRCFFKYLQQFKTVFLLSFIRFFYKGGHAGLCFCCFCLRLCHSYLFFVSGRLLKNTSWNWFRFVFSNVCAINPSSVLKCLLIHNQQRHTTGYGQIPAIGHLKILHYTQKDKPCFCSWFYDWAECWRKEKAQPELEVAG